MTTKAMRIAPPRKRLILAHFSSSSEGGVAVGVTVFCGGGGGPMLG